jgi:hypothetical protein
VGASWGMGATKGTAMSGWARTRTATPSARSGPYPEGGSRQLANGSASPAPPAGRHHLVLANQTIESLALRALLVERGRADGATFHLVVPATRISDQQQALVVSEHLRSIRSEDASVALARHRLVRGLATLRRVGLEVTGDVGDADPCLALREAFAEQQADEIIVSTLPSRLSPWTKGGLVRTVERSFAVPVTPVQAHTTALAALRDMTRRRALVSP